MNILPNTPYADLTTIQLLDRYLLLLMKAPALITILNGPDLVFELVNDSYQQLFPHRVLLGRPILEAIPEIKGQLIETILNKVFETGEPYLGNEVLVSLLRQNESLEDVYFNFIYQARLNDTGIIDGILVFAFEVTDIVESKKKAEENERSLRSLIMNARYSLMILRGENWVVEIANQEMANLWNRLLPEILGKPLLELLPNLVNQPFPALLRKVYQTAQPYKSAEEVFYLDTPVGQISKYVSFSYDPIFDAENKVNGIIVSAEDITEKVMNRKLLEKSLLAKKELVEELSHINFKLGEANKNLISSNLHLNSSRQELQQSNGMLQFSIEAANIGTWSLDLTSMVAAFSERQKELYGFLRTEDVGVEQFVNQVVLEYRQLAAGLMEDVINKGGLYDMTFPVLGFHDQKLRWLRVLGSLKLDEQGEKSHFSGVSIETTEQKQDELRKNQFINIVSHELKTPLTSAKVYIQLLQQKAVKTGDQYFADTLTKADLKLDKMTNLINGFLNISQLESGKIQLNITQFDLGKLIIEIISEIEFVRNEKIIEFTPIEKIFLRADRDKIGQVIMNLLSNAVKYASVIKQIKVSCQEITDQVKVSIQDFGIGISQEEQSQIFNRYYRVESAENKYISGFGIGLYLCNEIIQRHKGHLSVVSETGKGSTFSFSLPLNIID